MSKNLIAYFSRKGFNYSKGQIVFLETGNTETAAKKLQALTGADLFQIEPLLPIQRITGNAFRSQRKSLLPARDLLLKVFLIP